MSSGKFVLRLDPSDHASLKKEALEQNLSLNQLCRQKLTSNSSPGLETRVVASVTAAYPEALGILLYGSYARGQSGFGSDIDVMILMATSPSRELYRRWDRLIAPTVDQRISPAFSKWNPQSEPSGFWFELALDARLLWQKEVGVSQHLCDLRNRIASGEYKRSFVHGQPYWRKMGDQD